MKRALTLAVAAVALFGVSEQAQAATKKTEAGGFALTIGDSGSNVFGSVFSTDRCTQGRKVILQALLTNGQRKNLGSDRASRNGAFNVLVEEKPPGFDRYEVFVPAKRLSPKLKCGAGFGQVFEDR